MQLQIELFIRELTCLESRRNDLGSTKNKEQFFVPDGIKVGALGGWTSLLKKH